ncbi:MAG: tetratricopeptide repeat protein [Planctomycetes bacterium]|nr:tetratricopeptide repeat protein [Planctomycetota bacterium]
MSRPFQVVVVVGAFGLGVAIALWIGWPRGTPPAPAPPQEDPWSRAADLLERGELPAAAETARAELQRHDSAEGHALLGFIQYRIGDLEGARSLLNRAQDMDPSHPMTYLYRGQVYLSLADWRAARGDFDEFVRLQPDRPEGYALRADTRYHQYEFAGAIEDAVRAIRIDPECAEAYFARAAAYEALGRDEPALRDYTQCLALKPQHVYSLVNRGNLLARQGAMLRAALDWERAIKLKPELAGELRPLIEAAGVDLKP